VKLSNRIPIGDKGLLRHRRSPSWRDSFRRAKFQQSSAKGTFSRIHERFQIWGWRKV